MAELGDSSKALRPALTPEAKAERRRHAEQWRERREKLVRRIVEDPRKLDGAPHIRGTKFTIAEIQAAWAERGVYLAEMYERFRGLKPDDLEAALFHSTAPVETVTAEFDHYVAEWAGPPRRKLYMWRDDPVACAPAASGWHLIVNEFDDDGTELTAYILWEETFAAISLHPHDYVPHETVWRDAKSGEVIDIDSLNPQ